MTETEQKASAAAIITNHFVCPDCGTAAYQPFPRCPNHQSRAERELIAARDTEQSMHAAWRKRAEEAERELLSLRGAMSAEQLQSLIDEARPIAEALGRFADEQLTTTRGDSAGTVAYWYPAIARARTLLPQLAVAIEQLQSQLAKAEDDAKCSTCGGQPHASGLPCICGGSNKAWREAQGLREELVKCEMAMGVYTHIPATWMPIAQHEIEIAALRAAMQATEE
jgi:hypothetical protein